MGSILRAPVQHDLDACRLADRKPEQEPAVRRHAEEDESLEIEKPVFAFDRNERVKTPRGSGRISQAYDNGEYIAYEIYSDDGVLFMAEECEIEGAEPRPTVIRSCFSTKVWGTEPIKAKHLRH